MKGYDIAAGTTLEESGRGATIWDFFPLRDGRVALVAMDVPGDGPIPAHHLAMARVLLRELSRDYGELKELLPRVNDALNSASVEGIDQVVESGILILGHDQIEWAGAGQTPGGIIRRDGTFQEFPSHGPPLGMLGGFQYGTQRIPLGAGDMVIVLSRASQGLFRGAADLVVSLQGKTAGEVVTTVHKAIRKAQASAPREVTVLFVRKH